ncbi:filamentous haemagglutinin family protein [Variovorax sp. LT1R16]|uniref:filamentous haemagglutinin family protein n=1 Tax=Variovorax sp. LT1R16 TaxID=3443728 RepID=UPI003F48051B
MNTRGRSDKNLPGTGMQGRGFRRAPIAQAIAVALVASGVMVDAQAQRALGGAWFAAKGAVQNTAAQTGRLPNGMPVSSLTNPQAQQQQANAQLARSIDNLNLAARGIAAQQAAQAAARAAALAAGGGVPDGMAEGGLEVDTNSLTAGWLHANAPVPSQVDGRSHVAIQQTADKAILNWETFNVGKNTTVEFRQQADWAVLNRVNDPKARPSQIQGRIKGDGTVMVVNRNGVVFHGGSQVDTRNLVAAAAHIADAQFSANGLYSADSTPSVTDAQGKVEVRAGARIATLAPRTSTEGGGYVLLLGQEVHNAGEIATPKGQTALAAGDSFLIRKGVGTGGNQASTTRGNEITPQFLADSPAGLATNTGLIVAREGDVTMAGRELRQNGTVLSSTSVNTRGTVHLAASGAGGAVAFGAGSVTAIVLDDSGATALDSQRTGLMAPAVQIDSTSGIMRAGNDRRDLSRVEVSSGGTVAFESDSLTLATGGQVIVDAKQRSLVREGARIDVSGAVGVKLTMASNNVKINVQGNEQRDAPQNRDSQQLANSDLWIDRRSLVFVPGGTNGYAGERWYTGGGLLEVGGYLGTQGHSVGEWMAQGGALSFTGGDLVTQRGSSINLSGGTLDVQTGKINQSWLKGADGRLHEVSKAPGDLLYTGVYRGFEDAHARWGKNTTEFFYSPLIGPQQRLESGYTVGRDAGLLIVGTQAAVLEGDIVAEAFQGPRQTQAPQAGLDGYRQSALAASQRGQLVVGSYDSYFDRNSDALYRRLEAGGVKHVALDDAVQAIAAGLDLSTVLPAERRDTLVLDTELLGGFRLGAVRIAASESIAVDGALQAGQGGHITLYAPSVTVAADLVAHGGSIQLGNVLEQIGANSLKDTSTLAAPTGSIASVVLADGAALDTSGLWTNLSKDPVDSGGVAWRNGGTVSARSSGDVVLGEGSVIDVSSGAALLAKAKPQGGKGGSVTLEADGFNVGDGQVVLDGAVLRGHGVDGGGTLTLQTHRIAIGDTVGTAPAGTLRLGADFFDKGFGRYALIGNHGFAVAEGAQVEVTMPVFRFGTEALNAATGSRPAEALTLWTPPLYQEDPVKGVLTQRKGASLSLQAGTVGTRAEDLSTVRAVVGQGAVIAVDPGQSIDLRSVGQLTLDGALHAWGGSVGLTGLTARGFEAAQAAGHGRSIWLGGEALIDVAARAVSAVDDHGRSYGQVRDGGKIVIGGEIDPVTGIATASDLFVVVREGARLDASGDQAALDIPGQGRVQVASKGGSISLASNNGLYLDGRFTARAGGAGAAGGSLSVALESPYYIKEAVTDRVTPVRELVLGQVHQGSMLPGTAEAAADSLTYGHGRLGVDQVRAGGFDNLAVLSNGLLSFDGDVALEMGQSLRLYSGAMGLGEGSAANARVTLSAPYLQLAGIMAPPEPNRDWYLRPALSLPTMSQRETEAVFEASAKLIDVRGNVLFGALGKLPQANGSDVSVERRGFDDVQLNSQGDLRFLTGASPDAIALGISTQLLTKGDMTLRAAQLYPATDVGARVVAGFLSAVSEDFTGFDYDRTRTLTIARSGEGDAAVPYSAFGRLQLGGPTIHQGGVVRAPLGRLEIGALGSSDIVLQPGSLSSVSGKGLVLPYGGTVDGQAYSYDGKPVTFLGQGGNTNGELGVGMVLGSRSVVVQPGATVDLSGGGELLGAGFVSGRGGSTDARYHPLVQTGTQGGFVLPGLGTNPVYALVPGVQPGQAPVAPEGGASAALVGQQVTIGAGVPGLPAGTYTLMPSTYALMPGAFRVEINGLAGPGTGAGAQALRNGSWSATGRLSVAHTGIADAVASQLTLTPADTLRRYAQYNETGYAPFAMADAARLGVPRPLLPVDARTLKLGLRQGAGADAFSFEGIGRFEAAAGGYGGTVALLNMDYDGIEVVAAGKAATSGFGGITVAAESLNALGASRLMIGGMTVVLYGQTGNYINLVQGLNASNSSMILRDGAHLAAPEVFMVSKGDSGAVIVEQGASINTIGRGKASYDARNGFVYQVGNMLAVSNGLLNVISPTVVQDSGGIRLGVCSSAPCSGPAALYSEGSIVAITDKTLEMGEAVRYGTRHLNLGVSSINVGSAEALAAAAAGNRLPTGLTLTQPVLDRLLRGDTQFGAPALETLQLSARDSFNFYGTAALDTYDATTGKSLLSKLLLSTPAIYGAGDANDVATIHTANLIWQGAAAPAVAVVAGGAGTGSGRLDIRTERIDFGYGDFAQPSTTTTFDRLALGFADVNLQASERITANHKGSLSVYGSKGAYDPLQGFAYSGGNLHITTPLMTGEAASVNRIRAGGAIDIAASGGPVGQAEGLGAELSLQGDSIRLASAVVLPSGKLALDARGDVVLTDTASVDVSGRAIAFNDLTKYSAGGEVLLDSRAGNVMQAAGATIDLSARNNQAGRLRVVAVDGAAGIVDLAGAILGGSSGDYDAGGTLMPYLAGAVEVQAQRLGTSGSLDDQFAALNQRLNQGQVHGARSFQLKQGDLSIGNDVKAGTVSVSVDNGRLRVTGRVDASGERVGSITLAGRNGLSLDSSAVLDAHGSRLRVDSYGKIIDAPNRAIVNLASGTGPLTLADGVRIDLRHGTDVAVGSAAGQNDGRSRGTLELDAPRVFKPDGSSDDIAIDARGRLEIEGARSIALNGMALYDDAPTRTDATASGRPYQVIDQSYLDQKHALSERFIDAALRNDDLMRHRLAGLNNARYADAFHLRPGVEIVSRTPDGDLVVQGDIDLSGYRYASVNPHTPKNDAVYGSGEVGRLTLRAGGDLNIYGSINDGFAPPPPTDDDKGWILRAGIDYTGGNVVVPGSGVTLADGTTFPAGATLNFDLPIKAVNLIAGTRLPVPASLTAALVLPAGTVLAAAVRDAAGKVLYPAGTLLSQRVTLPVNSTLDAGSLLVSLARVKAMVWPKGVPLPGNLGTIATVSLNGSKVLPRGAILPTRTNVKLPGGAAFVQLRVEEAGRQGQNWAVAPMLADGAQSWSIRLVAGADTQAADSRQLQPHPVSGNLRLADSHYGSFGKGMMVWTEEGSLDWFGDDSMVGQPVRDADAYPGVCDDAPTHCVLSGDAYTLVAGASTRFSVVRTGAADLDLLAAGNLSMESLYGVYTAGSSSSATSANDPYNLGRALGANGKVLANAGGNEKLVNGGPDSLYRAWYPEGGGNLLLKVGGNLSGNIVSPSFSPFGRPVATDRGHDTANVGNWLWRQGNGLSGDQAQATAWWINFGSYTASLTGGADQMVGFTGFGTLGGGNLDVDVRGDAGIVRPLASGYADQNVNARSQGLVLAVGSTGRVAADGSLQLTGGGDLNLRVGGAVNPGSQITSGHLNGALVDVRGHVQLTGGALGSLTLRYGIRNGEKNPSEVRAFDPIGSGTARAAGGLSLLPGDATVSLATRGDLVVQEVADPGRAEQTNGSLYVSDAGVSGVGQSWFSLWTGRTAIDLMSLGGNLTPVSDEGTATDMAMVYPATLRAVAASGNLYYGRAAAMDPSTFPTHGALVLAPSANGQLEFLAGGSIYGGELVVSRSSAAPESLATILHPAFQAFASGVLIAGSGNVSSDGNMADLGLSPLFAFGPNSASLSGGDVLDPARFYALSGDLLGVNSGRTVNIINPENPRVGQTLHEGAGPVWMLAGRDIVSSGTGLGGTSVGAVGNQYKVAGNLFVHNSLTDISIVSAGRDIIYGAFNVAGPGTLELTAGRDIRMEDKVGVTSLGAVASGDKRPGASIVMQAGAGTQGPDYRRFVEGYLDPAKVVQAGEPLSLQSSKVAKTYENELVTWLAERFGFVGDSGQARAYYAALPAEQQRVFARDVYFAELKAAGREYTQDGGVRQGSYVRGRAAIAALFPDQDVAGSPLAYKGDITLFGGAGVHTDFGGDIQMLTPGGAQTFGIEGAAPPSTAGVITQGAGDIAVYSLGSILLGQSRIMTTFGGGIQAWSAAGDINAGRGSKTTVVYTPPKRVYDQWGNVTVSSVVPSTGAGIATLAPIPEVPAGDIDLIAPLGTIDAGEAGIRVSGNVNLAALQVVNAANVAVKGEATGIPTVAAVNVGALTNASAAAAQAAGAAQEVLQRERVAARQSLPSVFTVRVLGFGNEPAPGAEQAPASPRAALQPSRGLPYDPASPVQFVGVGQDFDAAQLARLSADQRRQLRQER